MDVIICLEIVQRASRNPDRLKRLSTVALVIKQVAIARCSPRHSVGDLSAVKSLPVMPDIIFWRLPGARTCSADHEFL